MSMCRRRCRCIGAWVWIRSFATAVMHKEGFVPLLDGVIPSETLVCSL